MLESLHIDLFWHDLAHFPPVRSMFSPTCCSFPFWYPSSLPRMNFVFASKQQSLQLHHQVQTGWDFVFLDSKHDCDWHAALCLQMLFLGCLFFLNNATMSDHAETYLCLALCKLHNHKPEMFLSLNKETDTNHSLNSFFTLLCGYQIFIMCVVLWYFCSL